MSIYLSPLEEDVMDDYKKKEDLGKCPKCGKLGCKCDPETCDCGSEPTICVECGMENDECECDNPDLQLSIDFE
jgi:hypothetical protein